LDSAEVLQKQAFLEPPENDGVAPRCSTVLTEIAIIPTPIKGDFRIGTRPNDRKFCRGGGMWSG
jgi:hypothetical protein